MTMPNGVIVSFALLDSGITPDHDKEYGFILFECPDGQDIQVFDEVLKTRYPSEEEAMTALQNAANTPSTVVFVNGYRLEYVD
jgi:hypothetical protein